jgi:malate dehydrogenase (oxaloacetate-decarboxylating)(NADP+)
MSLHPTGHERLNDPALNKSTAFTKDERARFGLRGLLPAAVSTQEGQMRRVLANMRRKESDIERYIFLTALQERNERLFFRTLLEHIDEVMPLVYTPTVGQACREFAHIFRHTRGFYVTPEDRGHIRENLGNWPEPDVRVVVITDGERILGLGDLGANGMGIPIGKLALYTGLGGIDPKYCLPVMFDIGTENEALRNDPLYLGVPAPRMRGDAYDELMDELVTALGDAYPKAVIQFEDFQTPNAYRLLNRYRKRMFCFNDDIQGTAAVALAGVQAASRVIGKGLADLRILFLGAGSAATGIGDLMVQAFVREGLPPDEARERVWFVDGKGLVVRSRTDLAEHKRPYAHDHAPLDFLSALHALKPSVLIGATGQPGTFTEAAVRAMASFNERPVIFALSNPTSRAECTAIQAHEWSEGRAVFAGGSPFPAIDLGDGRSRRVGQANNSYIFPGLGLGSVGCECTAVTDGMFLAAADALAREVTEAELDEGAVYPPLHRIREVSLAIATAVAEAAYAEGVARLARPAELQDHLRGLMYDPTY